MGLCSFISAAELIFKDFPSALMAVRGKAGLVVGRVNIKWGFCGHGFGNGKLIQIVRTILVNAETEKVSTKKSSCLVRYDASTKKKSARKPTCPPLDNIWLHPIFTPQLSNLVFLLDGSIFDYKLWRMVDRRKLRTERLTR
jgi:hypothetical protein